MQYCTREYALDIDSTAFIVRDFRNNNEFFLAIVRWRSIVEFYDIKFIKTT